MTSSPITCPWCGTQYAAFQSNCRNCGGPLPAPHSGEREARSASPARAQLAPAPVEAPPVPSSPDAPALPAPLPPPRSIADSYTWKLLFADGVGIVASVFAFIGAIFACVGSVLVVGIVTAPVGLPFALMGLVFGGGGGFFLRQRYLEKRRIVEVLRHGQAATGQIVNTTVNATVTVNGQHPWDIAYQFHVDGRDYEGQVTTLNPPGPQLQPGSAVHVLYMPAAPESNALYPHP